MQLSDIRPKNPALAYPGAKWRVASKIAPLIPPHKESIFLCGGGGGLMLQLPKTKVVVYNEIDGVLTNYMRVLRDQPNQLQRLIKLTEHSRRDWEMCLDGLLDDDISDVERARRTLVYYQWSVQPGAKNPGWRYMKKASDRGTPIAMELQNYDVYGLSNALCGVQITDFDVVDAIDKFDNEETFHFYDPPYPHEVRSMSWVYRHEFSHADHRRCAARLKKVCGHYIVCGKACELYSELFGDLESVTINVKSNGGKTIEEKIWLSESVAEWLKTTKNRQLSLFG